MSNGISLNVSCASCGGAVDTIEGQRVATCPYCQTLLYIDGDRGVYTVMFRNELDNAKVMASLKQWFDKGLKARDLPQKAMVTEVYPIYIPFWRFLARAAGWVCGYREEHYTDKNGNRHTRRVPLEKMVFRDFEWSEIACDPGDIGVTRLPSNRGQAVSHDEGGIPTFEATTSPDDARSRGIVAIRKMAVNSASVPNITFQQMHVLPKYLSQTFYPIWMCRYTYQGRTYFATLDGITGSSLSGRAPGDPLYQSLAIVGGAVAGGVITGLSLTALGSGIEIELGVIGAIAGLIIFGISFMFFRHGSEITEGDIAKPYKKSIRGLVQDTTGVEL